MRNLPCREPIISAIVVYRRSWKEIFPASTAKLGKETKPERRGLWKVPQLRKSKSVAFGHLFLVDFHKLLGKHKRFPHLPRPGGDSQRIYEVRKTKSCLPDPTAKEYITLSSNVVRWPVLK